MLQSCFVSICVEEGYVKQVLTILRHDWSMIATKLLCHTTLQIKLLQQCCAIPLSRLNCYRYVFHDCRCYFLSCNKFLYSSLKRKGKKVTLSDKMWTWDAWFYCVLFQQIETKCENKMILVIVEENKTEILNEFICRHSLIRVCNHSCCCFAVEAVSVRSLSCIK